MSAAMLLLRAMTSYDVILSLQKIREAIAWHHYRVSRGKGFIAKQINDDEKEFLEYSIILN